MGGDGDRERKHDPEAAPAGRPEGGGSPGSKRWRQFRRNRRAWGSLMALAGLYALSLLSELLCNDRPLFLRFEGRRYVPFLRFYAQDALLGNGVRTRVDYAALRASPRFAADPRNRMVCAPVPFGPHQVVDPATLETHRRVRVTVTPDVRIGRLNLTRDGSVSRPLGCAPFFGGLGDAALEGEALTNHWRTTPALEAAIEARFANRDAPAFEARLAPRAGEGPPLEVSMVAYAPRESPPQSVRLALREPDSPATAPFALLLAQHPDGTPRALKRRDWARLPETLRTNLLALATRSFADAPAVVAAPAAPGQPRIACRLESVSWPHRPVPGHWLGIDAAGRDVLARVLYALRTSMTFGLLLVGWAMLLGFVIGAVQGYFGSWLDLGVQRLIEIWSALPFLYVMILIGAVLGRSFGLLLLCYGLFNWIGISYYMRAEFLRLRRRPFVDAARCQGLGAVRIIVRHVLPNALTPLITLMPFSLVGAIASITALDYLGFGLPPLTPSWGELLQQAQQERRAWWLILYPSLMLFTVMLLTVLVGEGLRDAFDPKPRTRLR